MNRNPKFILTLLACLWLAACAGEAESHRAEFFVFGTMLEIIVADPDESKANEAFSEIQAAFQVMHRDWHAWEPGLLTGINDSLAAGMPATASEDIVTLVRRSQEIESLSEGAFNPAIGALVRLWGFHTSEYPIIGPPPSAAAIQDLLQHAPSSLDIQIDGLTLVSGNDLVQLDFGGIAKGYAIDIAMETLRSKGIEHAIVNAGGDLRVMGSKPDRPWRIAIRNPLGGIIGTIASDGDEAIFTSGVYERFRIDEKKRFPHILDPRTGWPVADVSASTVIASEGLLADAAATALIVAGRDDAFRIAGAMGLEQVLLIDSSGIVYLTASMNSRIEFNENVVREIVELTAD